MFQDMVHNFQYFVIHHLRIQNRYYYDVFFYCFYFFAKVLKSNRVSKYLFEGKFTDFDAEDALRKVLKSKSDVQFDAMVCANDMMAIGFYRVMKDLGVSIPAEVKVVGFDDAQFANYSSPRLSTINQNIYEQGQTCARTAFEVLSGKEVDRIVYTRLQPKFRQSCGCIPLNSLESVYVDTDSQLVDENKNQLTRLSQYMNDIDERNNILILLDILKGANTMRQFYYNLKHIIHLCSMDDMVINLYPIPMYLDPDEDIIIPEKMDVCMYSDIVRNNEEFNPAKKCSFF